MLGQNLCWLAEITMEDGNYAAALRGMRESLVELKKGTHGIMIGLCERQIGTLLLRQGHYGDAIRQFEIALEVWRNLTLSLNEFGCHLYLARCRYELSEMVPAERHLKEAATLLTTNTKWPWLRAHMVQSYAQLELYLGGADASYTARDLLLTALDVLQQNPREPDSMDPDRTSTLYHDLARAAAACEDWDTATRLAIVATVMSRRRTDIDALYNSVQHLLLLARCFAGAQDAHAAALIASAVHPVLVRMEISRDVATCRDIVRASSVQF